MSVLARLSADLGASERTLRRAADTGLIRADRISERRLSVADGERRYLHRHWAVLSGLRTALRTEPNVRLAVLFGSTARGDDSRNSDVDVVVHLRDPSRFRMLELEDRLSISIGRQVELLRLSDADRDRTLLAEVIADGRVLVDRDQAWPQLTGDARMSRRQAEQDLVVMASHALGRARRATLG